MRERQAGGEAVSNGRKDPELMALRRDLTACRCMSDGRADRLQALLEAIQQELARFEADVADRLDTVIELLAKKGHA
jgi:hypothetical protein